MSATVREALSSMRMSVAESTLTAEPMRRHSSSLSLPVCNFLPSTRPSAESRRVTSCSRLISRENMATVLPELLPMLRAMFSAMLVLPIPGRAAMSAKSPGFRPSMARSRSGRPVARPGMELSLDAASLIASKTLCTTLATGVSPPVSRSRLRAYIFRSAASSILSAWPEPAYTMFVISSPTEARARSSARSRTMAAYSSTFAAVGVISMSSKRYCWEFSFHTPRTRIWSSTVTASIVWP